MNKVWAVTAAVITLAAGGLVSTGTASATTPSTTPIVVADPAFRADQCS